VIPEAPRQQEICTIFFRDIDQPASVLEIELFPPVSSRDTEVELEGLRNSVRTKRTLQYIAPLLRFTYDPTVGADPENPEVPGIVLLTEYGRNLGLLIGDTEAGHE
jgi:hypothetical protein